LDDATRLSSAEYPIESGVGFAPCGQASSVYRDVNFCEAAWRSVGHSLDNLGKQFAILQGFPAA
jgi:hypothetical protein